MSRRAKGGPAPRSASLEGFLKAIHSDTVRLFLHEAETSTALHFSRGVVPKYLAIIAEAKAFLAHDLPAVLPAFPAVDRLAALKEAEAAVLAAPEPPREDKGEESPFVSEEKARAIVRATRVVFDSFAEIVDALEKARSEAAKRAAHAREERKRKRERRAAMTSEERERVNAAIEAAKGFKEAVENQARVAVRGSNAVIEPAVNSIPRGIVSVPAQEAKGEGNALEFIGRSDGGEERPGPAVQFLEKLSREVVLTGEEVLGPVERQVFLTILTQAARQNPADLVGVSISAYAALHDIDYAGAKKAIDKAMKSLLALCFRAGEEYAKKWNLPTHFRYIDALYGERDFAEGFYLVQLGTTMIGLISGQRAIQFPLFPALDLQANPHADLFIQLFSMHKCESWGAANADSLSVRKLAQAAGLLRDEKHLDRAKAIVERDLKASERSRGKFLAPFVSHAYTMNGSRVPTAKALALPPREWLQLCVRVKFREGVVDYSKKEKAIKERRERALLAEAVVNARSRNKKESK